MNSFSSVVRALEWNSPGSAPCSTPRSHRAADHAVDDRAEQVRPARSKEGSHDYRISPNRPSAARRSAHAHRGVADTLPELPSARRARYTATTLR